MNRFDYIVAMIEQTLETRSRRHILGGALVSVSLFFGGLALTVMTLKTDIKGDETENEIQDY